MTIVASDLNECIPSLLEFINRSQDDWAETTGKEAWDTHSKAPN